MIAALQLHRGTAVEYRRRQPPRPPSRQLSWRRTTCQPTSGARRPSPATLPLTSATTNRNPLTSPPRRAKSHHPRARSGANSHRQSPTPLRAPRCRRPTWSPRRRRPRTTSRTNGVAQTTCPHPSRSRENQADQRQGPATNRHRPRSRRRAATPRRTPSRQTHRSRTRRWPGA
jgi:hypothetical protein